MNRLKKLLRRGRRSSGVRARGLLARRYDNCDIYDCEEQCRDRKAAGKPNGVVLRLALRHQPGGAIFMRCDQAD
jgi:hypothetical protein